MSVLPKGTSGRAQLRLWDAISLLTGIVVGSAIFKLSPLIFSQSGSPGMALVVWLLGGVVSFCGALCFAEMASRDPRSGGEYNYLTTAFGPWAGFAFAWTQLAVIQTTNIAGMAYVFGDHAVRLLGGDSKAAEEPLVAVLLAAGAVVALTLLNVVGLRAGRSLQNVLTVIKLVGLAVLIVVGLCATPIDTTATFGVAGTSSVGPMSAGSLSVALIMVLYAYGGWNDAAFVVAEIEHPQRNVPRALFGGILLITLIYLLTNLAYWRALGWPGVTVSSEPAADVLGLVLGNRGAQAMALLVMLSALGAVNGLIFSVARVYARLAEDYSLVRRFMGTESGQFLRVALVIQGLLTTLVILTVGSPQGQELINTIPNQLGLGNIPFDEFRGGFDTMFAASALVFWPIFLLSGMAYLCLRIRQRSVPQFSAPWFPLPVILFIAASLFGCQAAWSYGYSLLIPVSVPVILGIPVFLVVRLGSEGLDRQTSLSPQRAAESKPMAAE